MPHHGRRNASDPGSSPSFTSLFVRHEEALHNVAKDAAQDGDTSYQEIPDPDLSERGRAACDGVGRRIFMAAQRYEKRIDTILSSPLKRALTTATIAARVISKLQGHPVNVVAVPALQEVGNNALEKGRALPCDTGVGLDELRCLFPSGIDFSLLEKWRSANGVEWMHDERKVVDRFRDVFPLLASIHDSGSIPVILSHRGVARRALSGCKDMTNGEVCSVRCGGCAGGQDPSFIFLEGAQLGDAEHNAHSSIDDVVSRPELFWSPSPALFSLSLLHLKPFAAAASPAMPCRHCSISSRTLFPQRGLVTY